MPVGKGSIARATNASSANLNTVARSAKEMSDVLTEIPVAQIQQVPDSWRKHEGKSLNNQDLLQSIQKFGLIEPVILRRLNEGQFQLLSGSRRLQAVSELGAEMIIARVIENISDEDAREIFNDLHANLVKDNTYIHELKFKAVTTISRDMPTYLL